MVQIGTGMEAQADLSASRHWFERFPRALPVGIFLLISAVTRPSQPAALFAQSGGFSVTETSGSGQVVVSGFGSMSVLDVEPGKDAIIDNSHVVAWDSTLHYEVSITTGTSGGFLGNLINSQTSGEGLVLRFSGRGKIYVCSRNRATFKAWMQAPGR